MPGREATLLAFLREYPANADVMTQAFAAIARVAAAPMPVHKKAITALLGGEVVAAIHNAIVGGLRDNAVTVVVQACHALAALIENGKHPALLRSLGCDGLVAAVKEAKDKFRDVPGKLFLGEALCAVSGLPSPQVGDCVVAVLMSRECDPVAVVDCSACSRCLLACAVSLHRTGGQGRTNMAGNDGLLRWRVPIRLRAV